VAALPREQTTLRLEYTDRRESPVPLRRPLLVAFAALVVIATGAATCPKPGRTSAYQREQILVSRYSEATDSMDYALADRLRAFEGHTDPVKRTGCETRDAGTRTREIHGRYGAGGYAEPLRAAAV